MINVSFSLVGRVAEAVGEPRLEYALVPPATIATVVDLMRVKYPLSAELTPSMQFTLNGRPVNQDAELAEGDCVEVSLSGSEH
jgi:hypothetical protein